MKNPRLRRLRAILTIVIVTVTLAVVALSGTVSADGKNSVTISNDQVQINLYNNLTKTNEIVNDSGTPVYGYDKWEPGYTQVEYFTLEVGSSTTDFDFVFDLTSTQDSELFDVIDVYYAEVSAPIADRSDVVNMKHIGTLDELIGSEEIKGSGTGSVTFAVVLQMQQSAGNIYQGKGCSEIHVSVTASPKI